MATELIILLTFVIMILAGVTKSIPSSFDEARPQLGARLEKQIQTGVKFSNADPGGLWKQPKN